MLKREFKINLKNFIMFVSIIVIMFILVFMLYPSITKDGQMIDELIKAMPEGLLSVFNMDLVSLNKVSGWLYTEGYLMVLLLGSCYVVVLASGLITKEEDDKTIDFLYSKPISRNKIIINKVLVGIIYLLLFNFIISITTLIGLIISSDFIFVEWLLMSLLPILLHLIMFFISILISMFYTKVRKSMSICLGITFLFYLISILSSLSDKLEFLKYITPFTYVDSSFVINSTVNISYIILSVVLIFVLNILSFVTYNKKEFIC